MRILIVADVLGVPNNGTSIAAYNLIKFLKEKGHEVRVLCSDKDKKDLPGYYICKIINLWPFNNYVKKNGIAPGSPDDKIILKALEGVDLVHCMMPFALGNRTAKLANERHIPITAGFHVQAENITSHVFMLKCGFINKPIYRVFFKKLYRYVDCIHYPTKFIQQDFEKAVGPTNGYVISNGVKLDYYKKEVKKPDNLKDKFVILSTGRYAKEKMQEVLLKAVKLSKYEKDIQVILAGEGVRRKLFTKLGKELTNEPILGLHPVEELIDVINYSDLYVHTAYAELESIACLEAIKCGLVPVINKSNRSATKFFALDENNNFNKNDPIDLAKKIDYWIENEQARKKRSDEYLNYANKFEFTHCMERMEKMMFEAVEVRKYKIEHNLNNRVVYYLDPINEDFAGTTIKTKLVNDKYVYVHNSLIWRLASFLAYFCLAKPLLFIFCKIKPCVKVKNKKVLKKIRKKGYFLYGNHTSMVDATIPQSCIIKRKKAYIVAHPDVISITGIKTLVQMFGVIPVPSSVETNEKYVECLKTRIKQKAAVIIFPEAHIWPYYTSVRPFLDVSFKYPAEFNAPVVAMATTYRYPKWKINKWRKPFMMITLSEPIYPLEGKTIKENQKYLRDQVYDFINKITSENNKNMDYINFVQTTSKSTKYEN